MHTYMHTYVHTYIHTCMHTYIKTYIHTHMHTCIHTYVRTYIRTCIHTYIHNTYLHRYTYVYSLLTSRYRCDSLLCDVSRFVTSNRQTYGTRVSGLQRQIKTVTFCCRLNLHVTRRNANWRITF